MPLFIFRTIFFSSPFLSPICSAFFRRHRVCVCVPAKLALWETLHSKLHNYEWSRWLTPRMQCVRKSSANPRCELKLCGVMWLMGDRATWRVTKYDRLLLQSQSHSINITKAHLRDKLSVIISYNVALVQSVMSLSLITMIKLYHAIWAKHRKN